MRNRSKLAGALLACAALHAAASVEAAPALDRDDMLSFLAQCIRTDAKGQPVWPAAGQPACRPDQLQRADTAVRWRKHDYGGRGDTDAAAGGYQISDSVLDRQGGRDVVVQTFDFGDAGRRFRRFDKGQGDGGDLIALVDGAAYGVLTEDGGAGLQWFVGEGCRTGEADGRLKSWLFFKDDVVRGQWTDAIARLTIGRSATECPARFGSAFTRYRRATVTVPIRVTDKTSRVSEGRKSVDTIVSEHFERETIGTSAHLERFFFGRGLGKYRWEAWAHQGRSPNRDVVAQAPGLASSGRCGPLAGSEPPAEGYVMTDCRTWTNLVWEAKPWAVSEYGWPDVAPFAAGN